MFNLHSNIRILSLIAGVALVGHASAETPEATSPVDAPLPDGDAAEQRPRPVEPGGLQFTPGEGFVARSADGDFSLGIGFRFQVLYTAVDPAKGPAEQSIQLRRARAQLAGNVFGKHDKYRLELAVSPSDVDLKDQTVRTSPLLEAYAEFDHLRDLTVRIGQFKVPFDRMRMSSDMTRQLVDYSNVTSEFSLDRDIGVDLKSNDFLGLKLFRYHAGVFSGEGRNSSSLGDFGLLYVARIEALPLGLFDDATEGDFERTGPRLSIGAAYVHVENATRDRGTIGNVPADKGTTDIDQGVADLSFKLAGFSLLGGGYLRSAERTSGPLVDATGAPILDANGKPIRTSPSRDGTGVVAQAGYLFPYTRLEASARWAAASGRTVAGHDGLPDSGELGGGLSYYLARHHLKVQTDYFRLYRKGDLSNGDNQFRLQLQLVL